MTRFNSAIADAPGPVAVAPDPSPAPVAGLRKMTFNIPKAKEKTAYPTLPDPQGHAADIAARIIERTAQFDALKGALETDKAELKFMALGHWFEVNHGRHEAPSSVAVASPGGEVLVTFQNRYSMLADETALLPVLGGRTSQFFRESFEIKIKGDALPADHAQVLVDALQQLFAQYGAEAALELKAGVKPTTEFHAARHLNLTVAENIALDNACPIIAMVKTKGRR